MQNYGVPRTTPQSRTMQGVPVHHAATHATTMPVQTVVHPTSLMVAPGSPLTPFAARRTPSPISSKSRTNMSAGGDGNGEGLSSASDLDAKIMELHEAQVREMRDRMSADKDLRESMHQNQEAISGIASRIDELLFDLRSEVPRLRQENSDLSSDLVHAKDCIGQNGKLIRELQQELQRERDDRQQSERTAHHQMLELMKSQENRVDTGMASLHSIQEKAHERLCKMQDGLEVQSGRMSKLETTYEQESLLANQRDQSLAKEVLELRQVFNQDYQNLAGQVSHVSHMLDTVDRNCSDVAPDVKRWAEDACIKRIAALEENLRLECAERSLSLQRLAQTINSGHAQVQTMKSKMDESDFRVASSTLATAVETSDGYAPFAGGSLLLKPGAWGTGTLDTSRRTSIPTVSSSHTMSTQLGSPRSSSLEVPRGSMYYNTRNTLPANYTVRSSSVTQPRRGA